ncbi:MAG: mechanosensitive ion channel domain-containing protein [Pseudomonadota bacterium]
MPLSNLLYDLLDDINKPVILWQAAIIVVCVGLGWMLSRMLRGAYADPADQSVMRAGVVNFGYVLTPIMIASLIGIAKLIAVPLLGKVHLLRVALPLVASMAVIRMAFYLLRRSFARRGPLGAALVTFEKIFALLVWLAVALYLTGMWPEVFQFLDSTTLPLGSHKVALSVIGQAVVSVVILLVLAMWAGAAIEERLMGVAGLHTSLKVVMSRMSRSLLIVVAVLLSLSMVGIDLTVLSVFGGALGVGLGLGMQKIASNYVSGFVILLERSLAIGDMITVDKYYGKVTQINTRYTILQGLDGVETVLPNEMLISGPVQNQSLSSRAVQVASQLTLAYDTDLDVALPLLAAAPNGVARVLADPGPGVALRKFSPDGYELDLVFWIDDPENGRGSVLSDVNKKVYALIQSGQIKLAYPARDTRALDAQMVSVLTGLTRLQG